MVSVASPLGPQEVAVLCSREHLGAYNLDTQCLYTQAEKVENGA